MARVRLTGLMAMMLALCSCSTDNLLVMHPVGPVAWAAWRFTLIDVAIMSLLIVPVGVVTALFVWRYRKSADAAYDPHFTHSLPIEMFMWGIPLALVCLLGVCSYESTFLVNPGAPTALTSDDNPLQVDVVTTDWQWVFIYPAQHIATIDMLVVPAGRRVQLRLTSTSVTNDFYIPQVAPMIDVMPGMRTADAFVVNRPENFEGFSADFSGAGFSWMQFAAQIVPAAQFNSWVATTQGSPESLSYAAFTTIAHPTMNVGAKPRYFSKVDPQLFDKVVQAARDGTVYPVPDSLMTNAPGASKAVGATMKQSS